jgi:hypothetical protein
VFSPNFRRGYRIFVAPHVWRLMARRPAAVGEGERRRGKHGQAREEICHGTLRIWITDFCSSLSLRSRVPDIFRSSTGASERRGKRNARVPLT